MNLGVQIGRASLYPGFSPPRSLTMRGRRPRSQQQTHRFACPYCGKRFADVLRHLNHRESKCSGWFVAPPAPSRSVSPLPPDPINNLEPIVDMDDTPLSPPPVSSEVDPQPYRTDFPAASKTYGHGKSFVNRLNNNKFVPHRIQNP